MSDEIRITLRLPSDVHTIVKNSAKTNSRSMNEEIVVALSTHYITNDATQKRLEKIERWMAEVEAFYAAQPTPTPVPFSGV